MNTRQDITLSSEIFKTFTNPYASGSEDFYQTSPLLTRKLLIHTSGIQDMMETLGAFWFGDIVASYLPRIIKHSRENDNHFYVARISKLEGSKALFTLDDGNDGDVLITQKIPYTDLEVNLRVFLQTDGTRWTMMLPSEY